MSGRCKSCDCILEEWEMKAIDPLTSTYTELCGDCLGESDEFDYEDFDMESLSTEDLL